MQPKLHYCGHPQINDRKDGRCGICQNAMSADWRSRNLEKTRASARAWNKANPKKHALSSWRSRLKVQMGSGAPEHFEIQKKAQDGKCAICGEVMRTGMAKACADHNHVSQQWRGILCSRCNAALGLLKDDIRILEAAIAYLKKWHAAATSTTP